MEVFEVLRINLNLETWLSGEILLLWVKGGKAVIGENCFLTVEAVWVHVCLALLLYMMPSGFLFWDIWVDLCNSPVQTAPEREGQVHMCVWAHVCMCVFACLNKDMGYGGTFAFEACRAWVAISWANKPHMKIFMSLGAVISVLFLLRSQGEVERGLKVREPLITARLHWFLLHTTKPKVTGQFCVFPRHFGSLPPCCLASPCSWAVRLACGALQ